MGQITYHKGDFRASVQWSRISIEQRRSLSKDIGEPVVDDPTTFLNMGDAFIRLDQFDSAVYCYSEAAKLRPVADVQMKIGDAWLRGADTAAALLAYEKAVAIDSLYVAGWDKIANIKGMRGDYPGSIEAFKVLSAINPADPNPWKMIYTNCKAMGDSVQMNLAAEEYYKRGGQ